MAKCKGDSKQFSKSCFCKEGMKSTKLSQPIISKNSIQLLLEKKVNQNIYLSSCLQTDDHN